MTGGRAALAFGLAIASAIACVPLPTPAITTLQTHPASELEPLLPGEAIAVLARGDLEDWTTTCLRGELSSGLPGRRVLDAPDVRALLSPWLEPSAAPKDEAEIVALIGQPEVAEKLRESRLRYLVFVAHVAHDAEPYGAELVSLGAEFGPVYDETTARIVDVRSGSLLEGGSAKAKGIVGYAHVVIYGVIAFSLTERAACHALTDALLKELTDRAERS